MFRLLTLGSIELRDAEGRELRAVLAQPKRVALLVYLATAQPLGAERRDRLVSLFWPELDEAHARDALNKAAHFLRSALGSETFTKRGSEEIGIDRSRLWCDAVALREELESGRMKKALELYRGPFLQGFFVEEVGGFDEWVERERRALRDTAASAARQLAEQYAADGEFTLAITCGRLALDLAPDDERALRRLLTIHERAGDRSGALTAYQEFAKRLAKDYGVSPSEETQSVVTRLRAATRGEGGEIGHSTGKRNIESA